VSDGSRPPVVEVEGLGIYYRLQQRRRMGIKQVLSRRGRRRPAPLIWALRGVSFTSHEGEALGVVGHNGAGKSTLCLALSRILEPDEGRVEVRGQVSTLLTLGAGFHRDLTGRENVLLNAAFLGIPRRVIEAHMESILDFAELGEFIDQPIRFYSSGMRARLAFGLSLAFNFDVYLSDEATAVGDAAFKAKATKAFKDRVGQASIIMVSHQTGMLRDLCQAGIWIHDGTATWFDNIKDAIQSYEKSIGK